MLTEQDVRLLLQEKSSPQARAEVAGKVAATLSSEGLKPHELQLAHDIIKAMLRDVSVEVRQALAENLKNSPGLPRDVALKMAQDVDSVALPILQFSTVLQDEDLVLVIDAGSDAKHQAIARRERVSGLVADALVLRGSESTLATLVSNRGADLNEIHMRKVLNKFPDSESIQDGLVHRDQLPMLVAERLVGVVSDTLRDYLVGRHELKAETVSNIILQNRERAVISLSARSGEEQGIEKMLAQMHANGRLTSTLVLRALCMGDVNFFENSLAVMANIPIVNARLLIHDAGRLGLKSIYGKTGLPERLMPAIRTALDVVRETEYDGHSNDRSRFRNRVIERILTQYEDLPEDDIAYLIEKIESVGDAPAAA